MIICLLLFFKAHIEIKKAMRAQKAAWSEWSMKAADEPKRMGAAAADTASYYGARAERLLEHFHCFTSSFSIHS